MKKTLKTAMTSAMFAAALGIGAGSAPVVSAERTSAPDFLPAEESLMDQTAETMVCVYGPPEVMSSLEAERTTTTTTTEELALSGTSPTAEETTTLPPEDPDLIPVPVYGPPSAFYEMSDVNMDRSLDARDLTVLKRVILQAQKEGVDPMAYIGDLGDVNGDGVLDKEDIKALRRMLTGKSKEEEDAEEAQTTTTAAIVTGLPETETTPIYIAPQPVYGPPEFFEQQ
ncbi:MAG: dockerin type I repeat-containing protein [Oscillospiraceae bacterium]|nr:dockerin type I repeat-containing protein [Oscillospiraceae bacterium]